MLEINVNKSIWIVEDDLLIQGVYTDVLSSTYTLLSITSFAEFSHSIELKPLPDLIILDLLFPEGHILQNFSQFGRVLNQVPFLVVSGLGEVEIVRKSLEIGAVDFLSKPFNQAEILVKIERLLLRQPQDLSHKKLISLDPIDMSFKTSLGGATKLTSTEYRILSLFLEAENATMTRDELYAALWKDATVSKKTLDVHLSNIRQKLLPHSWVLSAKGGNFRIEFSR